jgi:hypothetical protein
MEAFLGLIGLGIILWFVYALFDPEEAVYWHENPSRTKAFGYLLLGIFVIGSMNPDASESTTGDSTSADAQTESSADKQSGTVTYSEFQRVDSGMYYSEVKSIIGEGGTKVSSSEVDGFGEFSGVSTNMYKWQNSDGSNMIVMFQNNEVTSKSQFGLR